MFGDSLGEAPSEFGEHAPLRWVDGARHQRVVEVSGVLQPSVTAVRVYGEGPAVSTSGALNRFSATERPRIGESREMRCARPLDSAAVGT